jgi:CubicO group peptidase (beta-lactamase class C family)
VSLASLRSRPALAAALLLAGALAAGALLWVGHRASAEPPREPVAGGNEPPAPRVAPELESLDPRSLEEAGRYAGLHGSQALIVSRHDHIVFERYWHGSGFDTVSDAQSFTPLLAALATGVAISHRRIGWPDEPIGALIAEWRDDPRGAITVRDLLQSSSGLKPMAGAGRSGKDLAGAVLSEPLAATPGLRRLEQPAEPQLLALILERATHERYASYLSEALWRRIGAGDAWLELDRPGGTARADCCMLARQGDWIRIGELLLRDGNYRGDEVIRPGWVALLRTPSRADPAFGAYVRLTGPATPGGEGYAARDLFVVGGAGGNRLWLVPSLQIAILRTAAAVDAGWDETRIPNLIIHGARDFLPSPAPQGVDVSALVPGHQP